MQHKRISLILLAFLGLTTFISSAHAEIRITAISGESAKKNFIADGNNATLQIYGGFAGNMTDGDCPNANDLATCNSCEPDGTNFKICNLKRAYPSLRLQITITSTSLAPTSPTSRFIPKIEPAISGVGSITQINADPSPDEVTGPNQPATIAVEWSDLCAAIEDEDLADPTCNLTGTQSFNIGFDAGTDGLTVGEGDDKTQISITFGTPDAAYGTPATTDPATCNNYLCNFTLKPGDEKAIVEKIEFGTMVGNSLDPEAMILYCDPTTNFAEVTQSTPTARLTISGSGVTENKITGFSNGTTYSCHAAIEDEAGNIGAFFTAGNTCRAADGGGTECHQVTPDNVIGLFSKDTNCAIATAAYGSPMEAHVQRLRDFRNKYLAPSYIGRAVVKIYYAVSPPLARWIAQDPARRSTARALLTPVVWSVSVFMNWSWTLGLAVLFGCGFLALRRKFL